MELERKIIQGEGCIYGHPLNFHVKTIDNTYKANTHWRGERGERRAKATVNGGQMVKKERLLTKTVSIKPW